jgi:hypothetical protein
MIKRWQNMHNWQCLEIIKTNESQPQFLAVSAFEKSLVLINLQSFKILHELKFSEKIFSTKKISTNKILFGTESTLCLVSIEKNILKLIKKSNKKENQTQINCIDWFNKNNFAVTGSNNGHVSLWKFNSEINDFCLLHHIYPSTNGANPFIWSLISLNENGVFAVTNNTDSIVVFRVLFDMEVIEEIDVVKGLQSKISSVNWLKGKNRFWASYHSSGFIHEVEVSVKKGF